MIRFRVITPSNLIVDTHCRSVILPGINGEFQILPDHASMIAMLKPGAIVYNDIHLIITSGYAEIHDNILSVICEGQ